jgi:hypothetical protein
MKYVLIIHDVADYPAWEAIFDHAAGIRGQGGATSRGCTENTARASK